MQKTLISILVILLSTSFNSQALDVTIRNYSPMYISEHTLQMINMDNNENVTYRGGEIKTNSKIVDGLNIQSKGKYRIILDLGYVTKVFDMEYPSPNQERLVTEDITNPESDFIWITIDEDVNVTIDTYNIRNQILDLKGLYK